MKIKHTKQLTGLVILFVIILIGVLIVLSQAKTVADEPQRRPTRTGYEMELIYPDHSDPATRLSKADSVVYQYTTWQYYDDGSKTIKERWTEVSGGFEAFEMNREANMKYGVGMVPEKPATNDVRRIEWSELP